MDFRKNFQFVFCIYTCRCKGKCDNRILKVQVPTIKVQISSFIKNSLYLNFTLQLECVIHGKLASSWHQGSEPIAIESVNGRNGWLIFKRDFEQARWKNPVLYEMQLNLITRTEYHQKILISESPKVCHA